MASNGKDGEKEEQLVLEQSHIVMLVMMAAQVAMMRKVGVRVMIKVGLAMTRTMPVSVAGEKGDQVGCAIWICIHRFLCLSKASSHKMGLRLTAVVGSQQAGCAELLARTFEHIC